MWVLKKKIKKLKIIKKKKTIVAWSDDNGGIKKN